MRGHAALCDSSSTAMNNVNKSTSSMHRLVWTTQQRDERYHTLSRKQ